MQKVLAAAGIASRRAAEQMIAEGRVTVDGVVVTVQGRRVDPNTARIEVDGQRVNVGRAHEYILLNKPSGVVTTTSDPEGRRTVLDLVRSSRRIWPVGRLDAETTGLLLLTTDGELANRLMHPRYEVPRTYLAEVSGVPTETALKRLTDGVRLEDGIARARSARLRAKSRTRAQVEMTMTEGRKHEVRRMLEAIGHPVTKLGRTRFGPLSIGALRPGESRRLAAAEIGKLLESAGL